MRTKNKYRLLTEGGDIKDNSHYITDKDRKWLKNWDEHQLYLESDKYLYVVQMLSGKLKLYYADDYFFEYELMNSGLPQLTTNNDGPWFAAMKILNKYLTKEIMLQASLNGGLDYNSYYGYITVKFGSDLHKAIQNVFASLSNFKTVYIIPHDELETARANMEKK